MCIICKEWAKERMNLQEVLRASEELISTVETEKEKQHIQEVKEKAEKELYKYLFED